MVKCAIRVICFSILFFVLALPVLAQNTKGDKPTSNRDMRFKKAVKKEKPSKRIRQGRRTTSSLRAYKPRKKSKGGERAGRPTSPIYGSRPSEKPRNVFPQSGPYVNNKSRTAKDAKRRQSLPFQKRVVSRGPSEKSRNIYPQTGRFVNHSSTPDRTPKKRRVVPRSASRSFMARRSINAWANFPSASRKKEKAYTKDIAGRRLRTKNFETKRPGITSVPGGVSRSASGRTKNVYPRATRFSKPSARIRNVYPQTGPYVNNPSRKPKGLKVVSNRSTLAKLSRLQSRDRKPRPKGKVLPRSASGAYIARRSTNTWAHFPRAKHKGERAITKDIAGHPLRKKNFVTKGPGLIPSASPYGKRRVGDHPYKGPASGKHATATRPGRPWLGDITKRRVGGRRSKIRLEGQPGAGYRTASQPAEKRTGKLPLPVRPPGIGGKGLAKYQGNIKGRKGFNPQGEGYSGYIKGRRPLKGGGSVSGRLWNNQGTAVQGRLPGIGARGIEKYIGNIKGRKGFNPQGEGYSGNIKGGRPLKGGGSVSGRLWNNQETAVQGRVPGIGARGIEKYTGNLRGRKGFFPQGEGYSGNIKEGRPLKGGGSVSGRLWNNKETAVQGRVPGIGARGIEKYTGNLRSRKGFFPQGEGYTGNIKAGRPLKGGGSVSGRLWNNQGEAISPRVPGIGGKGLDKYEGFIKGRKGFSPQGETYSGGIKAQRPSKGGGSVSGKLWNNKETAVATRSPSNEGVKAGGYPGKIKRFELSPAFRNQGEEFTGTIKAKRPAKGGGSVSGSLWNNKETPVIVRAPREEQGGEFSGSVKAKRSYTKNDNAADLALKKLKPTKPTYQTGELQVKVKQHYTRNPHAADEALKVREPGKAFGRSGDFQGNIKMRKFDLFARRDLHPDAKFVKTNKNNVDEEKDLLTNFKLWWARLFKKNDTQPDHLKDKRGKPRYDKGEQGLWYD